MEMVSFWDDGNVLELHSGDGCTTWRNTLKTTQLYIFKCAFYVMLILSQFLRKIYLKQSHDF